MAAGGAPLVLPLTGDNLSLLESQSGPELGSYSRAVARAEAELADAYAALGRPYARAQPRDALTDAEESAVRHQRIEELRREYRQIAALPAAEAAVFLAKRHETSATRLQARWRSVSARRAFRAAVQRAALARRVAAAVRIQRAQRVRRSIMREAGPPISTDTVNRLSVAIGRRTVAMAAELQTAHRDADAGKLDPWPAWHVSPTWLGAAKAQGGPSIVRSLRSVAVSAQRQKRSHAALLSLLTSWDEQRAALQAQALRRQMERTTTAALHAQLCDPPPLPTAQAIMNSYERDVKSGPDGGAGAAAALDDLVLASTSSPATLEAHRSALRAIQAQVDAEGVAEEAMAAGHAAGSVGANPAAHAYAKSLRRLEGERESAGISTAELVWLASLEAHHDAILDPYPD